MGSTIKPDDRPLIEPENIFERFISGLATFERVGDVTFLVFYVDQLFGQSYERAPRERRVAARFVMPNDAVERMVRMLRPGSSVLMTAQMVSTLVN